MSSQDQQNWNHNFITFLAQVIHFTRLQIFKKHLSSYILFTLKPTRNSAFNIFYKILHFMKNSTKLSSPKLDTPSSRYEFWKLVFKYVKTIHKFNKYTNWQMGPADQWDPLISDARIEGMLRPAIYHRRRDLWWRRQHLRARLIKSRRWVCSARPEAHQK